MTRRERVIKALNFEETDLVPYHIGMTIPVRDKVKAHFKTDDPDTALGNHITTYWSELPWDESRANFPKDEFGVTWDREVDKDIGNPCDFVIKEPTLAGFKWPDPLDKRRFARVPDFLKRAGDKYLISNIGFSLFERAWTMRGMENIFMDMVEHPDFLHEFLDTIADWNIEIIKQALQYPFDAIEFGDDWGSQRGLLMGPVLWHEFIYPRIKRMYAAVHAGNRRVFIHSCGKVDELFDDLHGIGLNCFNPFQPEVMDTFAIAKKYKGRLAFFGGISTQRLLPYGSPDEVRREVRHILKTIGAGGGYIASPAHDTPKDVPLENILALHEALQTPRAKL